MGVKHIAALLLIFLLVSSKVLAWDPDYDRDQKVDIESGGTDETPQTTELDKATARSALDLVKYVELASCDGITEGICLNTTDHLYYYWDGDSVEELGAGGGGSGTVDTTGTVNADEIAVFNDSDTLKALTESEFKAAYNMEAGTDFLAPDGDGASLTNVLHDMTDDSTPQAGGDLDMAGNGINDDTGDNLVNFLDPILLPDLTEIEFGSDEDWDIQNDSTDSDALLISITNASDRYVKINNAGAGDSILEVDQISTAGIPIFDLVDSELNDTSTPHLLTLPELKNTLINNYNGTPGAKEYDFPVANEGWMFMVSCANTQDIVLDPNGSEQWYLNRVQGTAGQNIENTNCTKGEVVTCYSQQTDSGTYEVFCNSAYSDWTFE